MREPGEEDATRRTWLAAERTWLAWWRTGITALAAAAAVGGVVPQLVEGAKTPYVLLGAAYAVIAVVLFVAAGLRQARLEESLARGQWAPVDRRVLLGLTLAGIVLGFATLAVVIAES